MKRGVGRICGEWVDSGWGGEGRGEVEEGYMLEILQNNKKNMLWIKQFDKFIVLPAGFS